MSEFDVAWCLCEYVDVGVGSILAEPHPECPVHTMDILTAMTYFRHQSEREMGITPVRSHWGHEGCSCGCGPATAEGGAT